MSMREMRNNFHCMNPKCDYRTAAPTQSEAVAQLKADGGVFSHRKKACPKCAGVNLIYVKPINHLRGMRA